MELEKIKLNLKGVIGSSKDGILVNNLESEYKKITNSSLNYKNYNQSLIGFLTSMNDMVRLQYTNYGCYVHLSNNENAPQCLKKLCNLIQTTKSKKTTKKKYNIPNNIMSKANGYNNLKISVPNDLWSTYHETNGNGFDVRNNTNNNNSVGLNTINGYQSRVNNSYSQNDSYKYPNNANQSYNKILNEQSLNSSNLQSRQKNYPNVNNTPAYSSMSSYVQASNKLPNEKPFVTDNSCGQSNGFKSPIVDSSASKTINDRSLNSYGSQPKQNSYLNMNNTPAYSPMSSCTQASNKLPNDKPRVTDSKISTNESFQSNSKPYSISSSSTNSLDIISNQPFSNIGVSHQNETISAINMNKEESFIIDWPINLDISIDILHKPVRILGIQSGYALLTVGNTVSKSVYIPANSFFSMFPGDIFLWQPPIPDSNRSKSMIDICNAVPIIAIEQINDTMKVRVMGLKVLLIVHIHDVYKFPNNIFNFKKFLSEFEVRKLTFTRLAMIPKFVNYYNTDLLSDLYFSPDSFSDNEFIFERCEKRGDFLNIMILISYLNSDLRQISSSDQNIFVRNIVTALDNAKSALCNQVRAMLGGKSSECDMLLPIEHNRTPLKDRMLIGCERILSSHNETNENDLNLERMIYNDQNTGFYYFDSNSQTTAVFSTNSPIRGIYRINNEFVTSRLSNVTKFRFQISLLIRIPSVLKFRNISNKI